MGQTTPSKGNPERDNNDQEAREPSARLFMYGVILFGLCLTLWGLHISDVGIKVLMWMAFGVSCACLVFCVGIQLQTWPNSRSKQKFDRLGESLAEKLSSASGVLYFTGFVFAFMSFMAKLGESDNATYTVILLLGMAWLLGFLIFMSALESSSDPQRLRLICWLVFVVSVIVSVYYLCLSRFGIGFGWIVIGLTPMLAMRFVKRPRGLPF